MRADLVRAARLQAALDERVVAEALEHAEVRDSRLAVLMHDGHLLAVRRMTTDVALDDACLLADVAADDGPVDAVRRLCADLLREVEMRRVVLGRDHDARRVLVEAVDDARTDLAVDA